MHEMSIAVALVDQVVELAGQHGARRIDEVAIDVGILRLVVPEALTEAFKIVAEGTLAKGAELTIAEVTASAECRKCGHAYPAAVDDYLCPQCGQADPHFVGGNDIIIKSTEPLLLYLASIYEGKQLGIYIRMFEEFRNYVESIFKKTGEIRASNINALFKFRKK